VRKTKLVAFKRRDPVRSKIVIDNKIIEKVNPFNYLRTLITYEKEVDIDNILNEYLSVLWVAYATHSTLKPVATVPR
jgi:hypothetical protein